MRKVADGLRTAAALVVTIGWLACAVSAQAPQAQDGFRAATPEDLAAGQEHLPATPLVFAAYAIVWVVLVVYVLVLWRRVVRTERDVAEVRARLEARR